MASFDSVVRKALNINQLQLHIDRVESATRMVSRYKVMVPREEIHLYGHPYKRSQKRCPVCMKKCPGYDYKRESESAWRHVSINGVPIFIHYRPQRITCPEHGTLTEYIPWADGKSRFTKDFNNEVAWLVCRMPKSAISESMDINWRTVGNCVKAAHARLEPNVEDRIHCGLKRICVDETSYHKGYEYITVVYDMDRNRAVWVHDGHGESIFKLFCEALTPEERDKIEVVAGDGAKWIDTCTKNYFKNAKRCVDFFYGCGADVVVQWANEALDKVRSSTATKAANEYKRLLAEFKAEEQQEAEITADLKKSLKEAEDELAGMPHRGRPSKRRKELEEFVAQTRDLLAQKEEAQQSGKKAGRPRKEQLSPEHQQILDELEQKRKDVKDSKFALGHDPNKCTSRQEEKIKEIEASFPDLYRAYQLKETLRVTLHMKDVELATTELDKWIEDAGNCGLSPMVELAEKIGRHRTNIQNSIDLQANSAKSEACNTTIKVLISMGRGFRNLENLIALVYLKCSDLVIPLNNRYQPTAEQSAAMRLAAQAARRRRESEKFARKATATA